MSKKIISLAVAVLMIVAMLPVNIISANNSGETAASISYEFNTSCGVAGNTQLPQITDYGQTGNKWKYYSASRTSTHQVKDGYFLGDTRIVDHYIALNINVPDAGMYAVEYFYTKMKDEGGKGDVYLVPGATFANLSEAKTSGTKIASVDYSGEGISYGIKAESLVEYVTLPAGDNIILFVVAGKGEKSIANSVRDYFTYPSALALTPLDESEIEPDPEPDPEPEEPIEASYVFDNLELGVPGNTRIDTITSYEQTGDTWRYLAASPNAKASQLKNYYLNGDTRAVDHYIAVEINVPADGTYKPEFLYQTVEGRGGVGDIYILPEGGLTNLAEAKANGTKIASVDYSSDATKEKNEAEMLVDAIKLKEGTNVLLFVVTGKGAKATTGDVLDYFMYPYKLMLTKVEKTEPDPEPEIEQIEARYVFDNLELGVPGNTRIDTITSYDQTGNTWRFLNGSPYAKGSRLCNYYLSGDTRAIDQFIAVEINVPANGVYTPEILHYKMKGEGGIGDVYLLPEGGLTNLAEAKANGTKIASIDYSGEATVGNVKAEMLVDKIKLKGGTNVLLFVVTGKGAKATTESVRDYFTYPYMLKITGTKITEDAELTDAFAVKKEDLTGYVAPSMVSVTIDGTVVDAEKNADGSYNVEAPKVNKAGKAFLYWAKGLSKDRRIISFSNKLTSYIPDENGASILIAVYDDNGPETAEYYNANGQLIAKGEEPAKPSMAGYGTATAWKQYGEKNIYVAEYELSSPAKDIDVTVVNGTGSGTYAYGDTVTCTADATKENFKCWTKTDINGKTEIVSVDKTYTFKVWENCTVTAVYEPHTYSGNKAKIVLDTFAIDDETGIMAEFIGISDATEKGIMVGEQKIAMSKLGNQFTIVADKAGTYIGYAILKSGNVFYMITDGEVKVQ